MADDHPHGIRVSVDRVEYQEGALTPPHRPHQFSYHITIHHEGKQPVTLLGRKWIITNAKGHRLIVEGDGVVGQFPRLLPGDTFRYNSYHLADSNSRAEGAYLTKLETDEEDSNERAPFWVKAPPMELRVPIY